MRPINMKSKLTLLLIITTFGVSGIMSAQEATRDTSFSTSNFSLDEVVVTGTRSKTDVRHLSQTVSVIPRLSIEKSLQSSLLPVLTEQIPGLFTTSRGVMGYGVSNGAAGGISLRGLSGGNARLMVLIDGYPQYAGIFGHPIADAYQTLLADKVEVLRGPASVLYGSNAMGGVINIVTRKMHEDGIRTDVRAGYGSYNTLETELTNRIRKGRFSSVISGSYNRTDGHRENMPFEQYGGYAKLGYELASHWNTYADVNVTHFNATYPGPVSAGGLSFFYNWGDHWINDGYTPSAGEQPQDGRFNSFDDMMGLSLYQSARFFTGNRITFGFDWFRYGGEAWTEYVKGEKAGTCEDIVDKHEDEVAGYVDFRQDIGTWLTFNAGLRIDHHSRIGTEWVPQAGLAFHLSHNMELKASASKGFRYPILREMYMFPPQNPDLKPESMWNYEIAFSQRLLEGRLSYGVNVFYIDGKNLIMTLPRPNGSGMLNQNSGEIDNTGVEVQVAYRISQEWSADANYGVQYIAGLYTSVGDNPQTENFVLWNMCGQFRATKWLDLWIRGENLLAQRYEINAGYPMPRATVMGGINVNF